MAEIEEPRAAPETTFTPGALWGRVREATRRALAAGVLQPAETESHTLPEAGIPFSVRCLSTLREKERVRRARDGSAPDPFLPPDPHLLVAGVSASHLAVLNRFPVLRHHFLIVTREPEEQELPLTAADFDALARCLAEVDGLAFYNSHPEAGASQRHRHLQIVPFPVGDGPAPTPIEAALGPVLLDPGRATLPAYGFAHAACPLPASAWEASQAVPRAAAAMRLAYRALGARLGLGLAPGGPTAPYNLLATRRWMALFARRQGELRRGVGERPGLRRRAAGQGPRRPRDRPPPRPARRPPRRRRPDAPAVSRSTLASRIARPRQSSAASWVRCRIHRARQPAGRGATARKAAFCSPGSTRCPACSPRSSATAR